MRESKLANLIERWCKKERESVCVCERQREREREKEREKVFASVVALSSVQRE